MSEKTATPGDDSGVTRPAELLAREIEARVHAPLIKTAGLGNVLSMLAFVVRQQDQRIRQLEQEQSRTAALVRGLVPPGEGFSLPDSIQEALNSGDGSYRP
jgi:hypothetical protein